MLKCKHMTLRTKADDAGVNARADLEQQDRDVNTFHAPVYCTLVHKRRHSTHKSRSSIGTAVIQLAYTAITAMHIACVTAAVNDSPAPLVSSSQSLLPGRPHGIARCGIWLPMFRGLCVSMSVCQNHELC